MFATATVARHYGELSEVDWTFPWTKNRYTGCHCAWTRSAADISDTYDWKPQRSWPASFLDRAAVEAPDGEMQEENSSLGPLHDEASWQPCKTSSEGLPVGREGFSTGDIIVISMSSANDVRFGFEGVVAAVTPVRKKHSHVRSFTAPVLDRLRVHLISNPKNCELHFSCLPVHY